MTLLEREREALTAAPSHAELVLRLRAVVKEALASGESPEGVMRNLERLRKELRREHPALEDVVLDVMDFVEGWASPHMALVDQTLEGPSSRRSRLAR
jgi:hypothetical protein